MGVAAIYPLVDFVPDGATKMATRPDPSVPDFIGDGYPGLSRLYLDAAQPPSLTDTRVSPIYFANRESLPSRMLLIGAEHDMFCHEDEAMADKIAALSTGAKVDTEAGWRTPDIQWYKVFGQPHAFDAFPAKTNEKEALRFAAVDAMFSVVSDWLIEVFTKGDGLGV